MEDISIKYRGIAWSDPQYYPNLTDKDISRILEYARKSGTPVPGAGKHGAIVYEKAVNISGRVVRVHVVESSGGLIKTGFPIF